MNKELFLLKIYLSHYENLGDFISEEEKKEFDKIKEKISKMEVQNKLKGFK